MRSPTRAALTSTLVFGLLVPLTSSPAHAEQTQTGPTRPEPKSRQGSPATQDTALHWALRDSFLRYVGGATQTTDGAEKVQAQDQLVETEYTFRQKSVSFDAAKNETKAEFEGSVEYFKYCDQKEAKEGNCALELKVKDPIITISPAGGVVQADIRSKQYPSGQIFQGEDLTIADLDVANADFTSTAGGTGASTGGNNNGTTSWNNLIPSLTQDGVQAFSGFYNLGSPLAPINFSYQGQGAKPNIPASPMKLVGTYASPVIGDDPNRLFSVGDYVVVADKQTIAVANARNMLALNHIAADTGTNVLVATDKHDTVYWVSGNAVHSAKLSRSGLGQATRLATVEGTPVAIAAAPQGGTAYVLSRSGAEDATLTAVGTRTTTVKLPDPRTVDTSLSAVETGKLDGFYSETYSFNPLRDMHVMPDGNILYFNTIAITAADGSYRAVPPLVITPQGKVSLALDANGLNKQNEGSRLSKMSVTGSHVALYNDDYRDSQVRFFTYENGKLAPTSDRGTVTGTTGALGEISGVTFAPDGTAFVTAESDGSLHWVDPKTRTIQHTLRLPNSKGTKGEHRMLVTRDNGEVLANSVFVDTSTYLEYAHVLRIADPKVLRHDLGSELPELPGQPGDQGAMRSSGSSAMGSSTFGFLAALLAFPALFALLPAIAGMLPPHLIEMFRGILPH